MLSYEEVKKIGEFKRLSIKSAEKDYLQEALLFVIYDKIINKELVFKGGTCLYKIHKLNRFSEDLDFTLHKKLDIEKLAAKLEYNLELLGIKSRIKEIKKYKNEINVRLVLRGPLYKGRPEEECFIPLNISRREKVFLEPKRETIISLYRDIPNFTILAMDEREILAEKVRAALTREKPRDVYDMWFSLVQKGLLFDLNLINGKLKLYNLKFDHKSFIAAIERKRGLWQLDLKNLIIGSLPDFDKVKKEVAGRIPERAEIGSACQPE